MQSQMQLTLRTYLQADERFQLQLSCLTILLLSILTR